MLAVSVAASIGIVVAWFPASDLLHQREQLSATSAKLHTLDQQNQALVDEAKNLQSPSDIEHIAEQQYDLVKPGQQAYQVLPASGSGNGVGLATPATRPRGSTRSGSATGATSSSHHSSSSATSGGFVNRVLDTLEFWR